MITAIKGASTMHPALTTQTVFGPNAASDPAFYQDGPFTIAEAGCGTAIVIGLLTTVDALATGRRSSLAAARRRVPGDPPHRGLAHRDKILAAGLIEIDVRRLPSGDQAYAIAAAEVISRRGKSEAEIVSALIERIQRPRRTLVTFGGAAFELYILRRRAAKHWILGGALRCLDEWHPAAETFGIDGHLALTTVPLPVGDIGAGEASLDDAAALAGLPGDLDHGVESTPVRTAPELYFEYRCDPQKHLGAVLRLERWALRRAFNIYGLMLHQALLFGRTGIAGVRYSAVQLRDFLAYSGLVLADFEDWTSRISSRWPLPPEALPEHLRSPIDYSVR